MLFDQNVQVDPQLQIDCLREFNYSLKTTINVIKSLEESGYIVSYFETNPQRNGITEYGNLVQGQPTLAAQIHDIDSVNSLTVIT